MTSSTTARTAPTLPGELADRCCPVRRAARREYARFEAMTGTESSAWRLARLREVLRYASGNSPFYRRRLAGLPLDLPDLDDFGTLPFTTKQDLRDCYPFDLVAAPRTDLIRYGESTGTTGSPTSSAITYDDWVRGNVATEQAVGNWFGPGDTVFVAIPYELSFAAFDLDRALEMVGATVVGVGILSAVCPIERTARMLAQLRPTGLICTPTRALRLFDLLTEMGHDPAGLGLRTLLYVGETCSPAKLDKIAQLWGASLESAYGTTETNSLALTCGARSLHLTEDRHHFEVLDPSTGAPVPEGTEGELVLTTLAARAMPLIRYRTGDLVVIGPHRCACPSPRRTVRHLGRVSEQLDVDGGRLNKLALEQVVLSVPGTGLYYAAGVRDGGLEVLVECHSDDLSSVCAEVRDAVTDRFGITATVGPVDRHAVRRAMDRMLKPGSLTIEDLAALR